MGESSSSYFFLFGSNSNDTTPISNVVCREIHNVCTLHFGYNIRRFAHYLCMFDSKRRFIVAYTVDRPSVHLIHRQRAVHGGQSSSSIDWCEVIGGICASTVLVELVIRIDISIQGPSNCINLGRSAAVRSPY